MERPQKIQKTGKGSQTWERQCPSGKTRQGTVSARPRRAGGNPAGGNPAGGHSCEEGDIHMWKGSLGVGRSARGSGRLFQFAGVCKAIPERGSRGLGVMMLSPRPEEYEVGKGHADGPTRAGVPGTRQCHYWNGQTGLQDAASLPVLRQAESACGLGYPYRQPS